MEKIEFTGRLGTDPEHQVAQNGSEILTFPVALNFQQKDKFGNKTSKAKWHKVVISEQDKFQKIRNDFKKGSLVHLKGKVFSKESHDKYGRIRRTEIILIADNDDDINLSISPSLPPYYFD